MLRIIRYFSCIPRKIDINIKHILIKHYKIATILFALNTKVVLIAQLTALSTTEIIADSISLHSDITCATHPLKIGSSPLLLNM